MFAAAKINLKFMGFSIIRRPIITSELFGSVIKLTDEEIIDEYQKLKEFGCLKPKTELELCLKEQGFLIEVEQLKDILSETQNLFEDRLQLTIFPTEAYNFRCKYCYESHSPHCMSQRVIKSLAKYIEKATTEYSKLTIGWFGGEPTLCKDVILEINRISKDSFNDFDQFASSMTTNGYLLDKDSFIEYYESGVKNFQVTLDAWKHDEIRILKSGEGTLKKILKNLDDIHELPSSYDFSIILRRNILANDYDLSWYDYLNTKYGSDSRFSILVHTVNDMGGAGVKALELPVGNSGSKLLNYHLEHIRKLEIKLENDSIDQSNDLGRKFCYASFKNHFSIRADGRVEKCTVALDEPENQIGYLDLDGNMHIDETKNKQWYQLDLKDNCYLCDQILTCMNKNAHGKE